MALGALELFVIDIITETVVTFSEACRHLPRRRRGRKVHPSTIWRWAKHGLRGHRLEVIKIGGQTCTSLEAMQRFFDLLSEYGSEQRIQTRNERDHLRVERELAKYGL